VFVSCRCKFVCSCLCVHRIVLCKSHFSMVVACLVCVCRICVRVPVCAGECVCAILHSTGKRVYVEEFKFVPLLKLVLVSLFLHLLFLPSLSPCLTFARARALSLSLFLFSPPPLCPLSLSPHFPSSLISSLSCARALSFALSLSRRLGLQYCVYLCVRVYVCVWASV